MTAAALAPVLFQPDGNEEGGFIQLLTHPFQTIQHSLHTHKEFSGEEQELEIVLFAEDFTLSNSCREIVELTSDNLPNEESITQSVLPEPEISFQALVFDEPETFLPDFPTSNNLELENEALSQPSEELEQAIPEVVDIYISELAKFLYYEYKHRLTSGTTGLCRLLNDKFTDRYYTFKERCHSSHDYKVNAIVTSCIIALMSIVIVVCAMWPKPASAKPTLPALNISELNSTLPIDFKEVLGEEKVITINNPNYPTTTVANTSSGVAVSQTPLYGSTYVEIYLIHNGVTTIAGKLYDFSKDGEFAPMSKFEYECFGLSPFKGNDIVISYFKPGTQQVLKCNAKLILSNDKKTDLGYGLKDRLLVQIGKTPPIPLSPIASEIEVYPTGNTSESLRTPQKKD